MKKKAVLATVLAAALGCTYMAGCNGFGGSDDVQFLVYANTEEELATYTEMTNEFNATYGKEHGIKVQMSFKDPTAYASYIQTTASTSSGPDVFLIVEDNFKKYVNANYIADITEEVAAIDDIDVTDIYATMTNRLRYNASNNTSDSDDPLYGLPIDTKPTAIYYNESLFEKAGIITISVDEEDMDEWNKGGFKDRRGKTREDYEAEYPQLKELGDIPAKGYFRSEHPYSVYSGGWIEPDTSYEVLVFNNRIAMNWDEAEDLAMIFSTDTKGKETKYGTEYGYFTEWWFNYGWSVGGDCLTDMTGDGDWNFSLLDPNPNYIVLDGQTYVGEYTGTTYQAGETLAFNDRMEIPKGEAANVVPDSVGGYTLNGGKISERASLAAAVEAGVLYELPSTREAFTRYLKLGAAKTTYIDNEPGLNVAPNPNIFTLSSKPVNYFISQDLAMLVEYSIYMTQIADYSKEYGFEWDVAPLVVYKEYKDPSDPYCDEALVRGKVAGHSNSTAMVVRKRSQKKENAARFVTWMASKAGQSVRVDDGFFPNQESLLEKVTFPKDNAPTNMRVFAEALEYQGAGDWWYMSDYEWINEWAVPLNDQVRNGLLDFATWCSTYVSSTNEMLKGY